MMQLVNKNKKKKSVYYLVVVCVFLWLLFVLLNFTSVRRFIHLFEFRFIYLPKNHSIRVSIFYHGKAEFPSHLLSGHSRNEIKILLHTIV